MPASIPLVCVLSLFLSFAKFTHRFLCKESMSMYTTGNSRKRVGPQRAGAAPSRGLARRTYARGRALGRPCAMVMKAAYSGLRVLQVQRAEFRVLPRPRCTLAELHLRGVVERGVGEPPLRTCITCLHLHQSVIISFVKKPPPDPREYLVQPLAQAPCQMTHVHTLHGALLGSCLVKFVW